MMLRHGVASLVIFAMLVTLSVSIYNGVEDNYGLVRNGTDSSGRNVMENLNNLNIIQGLNATTSAIYTIQAPTSSLFDILGALAGAGVGALQLVGGLLTFPVEIFGVVTGFYTGIPPIIPVALVILIAIYVGFMLLSAYLRDQV